jgi:chromosome segregation ATPase
MFKKILFIAIGVAGLAFLVMGPAAFSHASHAIGSAKSAVEDAFPVEYELERAEATVRKIGPEVDKAKRVVAEEQVEIAELEREIARLEKRAEEGGRKVRVQHAALKTGDSTFVLGARRMSRAQLEHELRGAFDGLRNDETLLESKRKLLDARVGALSAAIRKLETVKAEEAGLMTTIENLRARLRHTQALEACGSKMTLDDGALARAKEILERCRRRVDVAAKMVENESGASPFATSADSRDVVAEVDRYIGGDAAVEVEAQGTVVAPVAAKGL